MRQLLKRWKNCTRNQYRFKNGKWELGENVRLYDTYFEIYYEGITKFCGNTLDKEIELCNRDGINLNTCKKIFNDILPEYTLIGFPEEEPEEDEESIYDNLYLQNRSN